MKERRIGRGTGRSRTSRSGSKKVRSRSRGAGGGGARPGRDVWKYNEMKASHRAGGSRNKIGRERGEQAVGKGI